MNYYEPRQLAENGKPTGLYHYTCKNDNKIWPVGPCADDCDGHKTPEEACEHYRQWLIEGVIFRKKETEWPKEKCEIDGCNNEAKLIGVSVNEPGQFNQRRFCPEHATKEQMAKFIHVGSCISSY